MSEINSLQELLVEELQDLYSAEKQLVQALPKMAKAAANADLKAGFTAHLEETRVHVQRLEQAIRTLDEKPGGKTCKAMKGLVEEGAEAIEVEAPDALRDAKLIGAAQRVEHYEIAAYGTSCAFAEVLGLEDVAHLLQQTLDEESAADEKLTAVSATVNEEANSSLEAAEGGDDAEAAPRATAVRKTKAKAKAGR